MRAVRARRIPLDGAEAPAGREAPDYADAFEVPLRESDSRSPEAFARAALEDAPWLVREAVWVAHRYVLRLRLAPRSSPAHLRGWTIVTSKPDVMQLEAISPLLGRGVIVGRRPDPTRAVLTTYIFFTRPAVARVLWAAIGPLHRRVAPFLLERAAVR